MLLHQEGEVCSRDLEEIQDGGLQGSEGFDPTLYRQLIESLMYLVNTLPDISFAVNSLSHFMVDRRRVH